MSRKDSTPPRVFLSYAHESPEYKAKVLGLSNQLREDGIDARLDQFEAAPREGWPRWTQKEIEEADFVLVLCTETYDRRFRLGEEPATGLGVTWEAGIITLKLYENQGRNDKFIPCVWSKRDLRFIPDPLRQTTSYILADDEGYEDLYARLTGQSRVPKSEVRRLRPVKPLSAHLRHHPSVPTPRYEDDETRMLSQRLEELYQRKEDLTIAGKDTGGGVEEIRGVNRRLWKGPRLRAGQHLQEGRYRLIERIGKGGFATVWKAYDRKRQELVAVKILHGHLAEDRSRRERFFRGARRMAELQHPHIVRVLEPELKEDGWHFYVMEYIEGTDFDQAVLTRQLQMEQKLRIIKEVADALDFAHNRSIIHRDVKPSNILLDTDLRAKLTDFDLVRAQDSLDMTSTREMLGTLQFAAPEALISPKQVDRSADVYSLASCLIFALLGKPLPRAYYQNPKPTIDALGVNPQLRELLADAVSSDSNRRPKSTVDFLESVQTCLVTSPPSNDIGQRKEETPKRVFVLRSRYSIASLALLAILSATYAINSGLIFRNETPRSQSSLVSSKVDRSWIPLGGAAVNRAGIPVKLITTSETQLYREADSNSESAPCSMFKFWYVLPPTEEASSRWIDDIGALTLNGFYRVAATDDERDFKGWIPKVDAVEWHERKALTFSEKSGRRRGHFYPSEVAALRAVASGDTSQAVYAEPIGPQSSMTAIPILMSKIVTVDGKRMSLYKVAIMTTEPGDSPVDIDVGTRIPGVEGNVTPQRVVMDSTVDIVFVIDTTYGMQQAIEQLRSTVKQVIRKLDSNKPLRAKLRMGLVAYRDTVPDMESMEYLAKTFCSLDQCRDLNFLLNRLDYLREATVSSDIPEDALAGLEVAIDLETMKWNPLGWKRIVVISDSSIKGPDHPDAASQVNEGSRTIAGFMDKIQGSMSTRTPFVVSAVRIHHPNHKNDNTIGDRQFQMLVSGRAYVGTFITVRGGDEPEDFSGKLTEDILRSLESFDQAVLKGAPLREQRESGRGPAGTTAADFPWPMLDILKAVGQGSSNGMQFKDSYATEFDADGNRVFIPRVFIRRGSLLSFSSMLDLLQGQLEDAGDPGNRDVTTILRALQAVSDTLNLPPITADMPIDKFLNVLLGFPVKNPIFQKTIGDLAAMSQTDYDNWVKSIRAQKATLKALTEDVHIWKKLHPDVNDRAAHAFIPLSDLP